MFSLSSSGQRVLLTYSLSVSTSPEIFSLLSVTTPLETFLNVVSREDSTYHIEKSEIICQSVDSLILAVVFLNTLAYCVSLEL